MFVVSTVRFFISVFMSADNISPASIFLSNFTVFASLHATHTIAVERTSIIAVNINIIFFFIFLSPLVPCDYNVAVRAMHRFVFINFCSCQLNGVPLFLCTGIIHFIDIAKKV